MNQQIHLKPQFVLGAASMASGAALVVSVITNASLGLFSTLCDNFCLWNREMLTEKDFYDYFAEETISIGFVSTQKPEEPLWQRYLFT
jgi:hypothetical protein